MDDTEYQALARYLARCFAIVGVLLRVWNQQSLAPLTVCLEGGNRVNAVAHVTLGLGPDTLSRLRSVGWFPQSLHACLSKCVMKSSSSIIKPRLPIQQRRQGGFIKDATRLKQKGHALPSSVETRPSPAQEAQFRVSSNRRACRA